MQATVCGKIKDTSLYSALDAAASLIDKVERIYFREHFVKHGDRNELKRAFLKEYGITGRQLNGVIFSLSGKVEPTNKPFCGIWIPRYGSLILLVSVSRPPSRVCVRIGSRFTSIRGRSLNWSIRFQSSKRG